MPDRPRPGARRPDARRPRRARGAEGAASADEALARRGRAVAARASTSSADAAGSRSTSVAPATCAPAFARTSPAVASVPRSRRRSARWSGSTGRWPAPSSRRRSRSSGCSASCGRLRTRAARAPIATSTCAAAARAGRVSSEPTPLGPLPGRRLARTAARALDGHESDDVEAALPVLRERIRRLGRDQRFEDAARLRDRLEGLDEAVTALRELERLRALEACVVVPRPRGGVRPRARDRRGACRRGAPRAAWSRRRPRGRGARRRGGAGGAVQAPEDADELRLVASFLRRPPPELRVGPLDVAAICVLVQGLPLAA